MMRAGPPPPLSRRVFDRYDHNKQGFINAADFHHLCYDMGYYLSKEERELAMLKIDTSGDGQISYDEFHKFWTTDNRFRNLQLNEKQQERLQKIVQYFRFWDKENNGTLSREEFQNCYGDLVKHGATKKTFEECFGDLDSDRNGLISFNEFVEWFDLPKLRR